MNDSKILTPPSYDELWRTAWGDQQRFGPVHRHRLEELVRVISALDVRTVLDVGCGSGEHLVPLAGVGRYILTGSDISNEALGLAKHRVPTARFVHLDIEREALPEPFDLVMSHQVIEHLLDDVGALRNLARMARSYVFISTMQGRMRKSEVSIGHVRNYSGVELRRKLEGAGLEVLKMWGWGFPFYSPLVRTVVEWLPGGPPTGSFGLLEKTIAQFLYHLYRFNWPGRGDVLCALAHLREGQHNN